MSGASNAITADREFFKALTDGNCEAMKQLLADDFILMLADDFILMNVMRGVVVPNECDERS
jgi:ketosteroid isomerase-like protein